MNIYSSYFKVYIFENNTCVQDDINITPDQIQTVDNEIKMSQLSDPKKISYKNVWSFLIKLHKLFNWDKDESRRDIGKEAYLKY